MPHAESEGWQRNVWALALIVFTAFVGFQFFSPFLPLYVQELGVTDPARVAIWSGVLLAVTPSVAAVLAPVWGILADRVGRKLMMIRSLVGFLLLFKEVRPGQPGGATSRPARLPFRDLVRVRYFPLVLGLLIIAQFIDRGLALLIPLKVAHLPGLPRIAVISGVIISVSAVCGTLAATLAGALAWLAALLLLLVARDLITRHP